MMTGELLWMAWQSQGYDVPLVLCCTLMNLEHGVTHPGTGYVTPDGEVIGWLDDGDVGEPLYVDFHPAQLSDTAVRHLKKMARRFLVNDDGTWCTELVELREHPEMHQWANS